MSTVGSPAGDRAAGLRSLDSVLEHLPARVAYVDRDLRVRFANTAVARWFGLTLDEIIGIDMRELLGDATFELNRPHIVAALAGHGQTFDRTLVNHEDEVRHTQVSYVPDKSDGEVHGFFVMNVDVTSRVEAQQALEEAQSLAHLGSWSYVVATGEIIWSRELYRIFGVEEGCFTPSLEALNAMVHVDDRDEVVRRRDLAISRGVPYEVHARICRPDGTVREVVSRARAVVDEHDDVVRLTGTLQDVTEENEAARELARVNTELVQLNELNADVVGILGHDLRGPLAVVLGYLTHLDEAWETSSEEERRANVSEARSAAVGLRTLLDDILALASVESGMIMAEVSSHDLGHLVDEAIAAVPGRTDFAVRGDRGLQVWCDAFHVRQIIANLAGNAVRYGEPPFVITLEGCDDTVAVTVTDAGPGVPEQFVAHLFDRFARGPGDHRAGSAGLGLYIAHRLAEANDCTLTYRPCPAGRGAEFTLTLPRVG
ncbi:sensor histidine kinase [Nocardioides taihuensis]|uniref:histidine kinase n=1 Tax=Nocardioides taihuensis TaxID=1835606 RepID=A0ABW0BLV0_9ACTN